MFGLKEECLKLSSYRCFAAYEVAAASAPVASFRCRAKLNREADSKLPAGTANLFATKAERQEHRAEDPFFSRLAKKISWRSCPRKASARTE